MNYKKFPQKVTDKNNLMMCLECGQILQEGSLRDTQYHKDSTKHTLYVQPITHSFECKTCQFKLGLDDFLRSEAYKGLYGVTLILDTMHKYQFKESQ